MIWAKADYWKERVSKASIKWRGPEVTRPRLAVISFLVIALAVIISVSAQSNSFTAHAVPGSEEPCSTCHQSAITCDDCTECHIPTIIYLLSESSLYQAHHDLVSQAIIPPATNVLGSCIDAQCHDAGDARYVTGISPDHTYCRICHSSGAGGVEPGPNDCMGCHIE